MKKFELIDYFMVFAIIFFMFVGTMSVFSQTFKGEDFKLTTENNISTFTFEDKNSNGKWISGTLVKNYLKVSSQKRSTSLKIIQYLNPNILPKLKSIGLVRR